MKRIWSSEFLNKVAQERFLKAILYSLSTLILAYNPDSQSRQTPFGCRIFVSLLQFLVSKMSKYTSFSGLTGAFWKSMIALILVLTHTKSLAQTTYYTRVASGTWTTASTWSTVSCSGAAATSTPGTNDNVVICTGHTVAYDATSVTTIANLTIQTSGTLTMNVNRNLLVNSVVIDGIVNGGSGGDIRVGNTAGSTISGTGSFNTTSNNTQLRLLSNVTIVAGTDLKFNANGRFHLNGLVATNNGKITIGANSTFAGGGTFVNNASTSYLLFSRSANWPNATSLTATAIGNTVEYAAAGGTRLMDNQSNYYHLIISGGGTKRFRAANTNVRGNLTISNGVILDTNTGTRTINIAGNWVNNLGGTFSENTSLVTFNGSANNQSLSPPAGGLVYAHIF